MTGVQTCALPISKVLGEREGVVDDEVEVLGKRDGVVVEKEVVGVGGSLSKTNVLGGMDGREVGISFKFCISVGDRDGILEMVLFIKPDG